MDIIKKYRKPVILTLLACVVLATAWAVYYSVFVFHITSTDPALNRVSTSAPYIKVTFNKPINPKSVRLTSNDVSVASNVNGKTLTINLLEVMTDGKSYTIDINAISSTTGDAIKNYALQFIPSNNPSYITPDQGQTILNNQENNKSPVLTDPIFQYLPYSTLDYSLNGVINSNNSITITITIQLSDADVSSGQDAAVAQYKQEAMTYLESLSGVDLSKYTIVTNVISPTD